MWQSPPPTMILILLKQSGIVRCFDFISTSQREHSTPPQGWVLDYIHLYDSYWGGGQKIDGVARDDATTLLLEKAPLCPCCCKTIVRFHISCYISDLHSNITKIRTQIVFLYRPLRQPKCPSFKRPQNQYDPIGTGCERRNLKRLLICQEKIAGNNG